MDVVLGAVVLAPVAAGQPRWAIASTGQGAYTGKMADELFSGRSARLIAERDEAYARMRRLVPQLNTGRVLPAQLTARQREAVETFDRLDRLTHDARGRSGAGVRT